MAQTAAPPTRPGGASRRAAVASTVRGVAPTLPPLPAPTRVAQAPQPPADLRRRPDFVLPSDPSAELPPGALTGSTNPAPLRPRPEPAGPATPPLAPWTAPSPPVVPPTGEPTMALPPSRPGEEEILIQPGSPTPPSPTGPAGPLTLADFERMAIGRNPTLRQAAAIVNVSRGKAWQAGLWPNPFVAYVADQVGSGGEVGEFQGMRFQQEIPSANKRRISRRKYEWEAETANWLAVGQQLRVLNGVQIRFYEVLAHQRVLDYRRLLYKIADAGLRTTEEMVNVGQANRPDLLAAQVQQQQARIDLINAENQHRRAWINLITVVGARELRHQMARLDGPLEALDPLMDYDGSLAYILQHSPELKAAHAEVRRDEVTVLRERVEPIPNTFVRGDVGYNFESQSTVANYFVGWNLPVWNKNQGTLFEAQSDLARARANIERLELALENRLADVYAQYNTAHATVRIFRDETLPRARQAYQLLEESYRKKRAAWAQVLVAQRNWVELSVGYVNALFELRHREVEIRGLLLVDGLDHPPSPANLGHINAVETPR